MQAPHQGAPEVVLGVAGVRIALLDFLGPGPVPGKAVREAVWVPADVAPDDRRQGRAKLKGTGRVTNRVTNRLTGRIQKAGRKLLCGGAVARKPPPPLLGRCARRGVLGRGCRTGGGVDPYISGSK